MYHTLDIVEVEKPRSDVGSNRYSISMWTIAVIELWCIALYYCQILSLSETFVDPQYVRMFEGRQ
mgnify:FL=1